MTEGAPPVERQPATKGSDILALISLTLGVVSVCAWLLPVCGLPATLLGLVCGIAGHKTTYRNVLTGGVFLCALGLVATILNAALGATAYLSAMIPR